MGDFSPLGLIGTFVAIIVPVLFWCWRVSANQKNVIEAVDNLTAMHEDPESVFSSAKTERLIERHIHQEKEMMRGIQTSISNLDRTIRELTYYIRWQTTQGASGKKPPPFIDQA